MQQIACAECYLHRQSGEGPIADADQECRCYDRARDEDGTRETGTSYSRDSSRWSEAHALIQSGEHEKGSEQIAGETATDRPWQEWSKFEEAIRQKYETQKMGYLAGRNLCSLHPEAGTLKPSNSRHEA